MNLPRLESQYCLARRQRLLSVMQRLGLDAVVVTQNAHVQWLCGPFFWPYFSPAAMLTADGKLTAVIPKKRVAPADVCADEVLEYSVAQYSTMRNDQRAVSSGVLATALKGRKFRKIGVEFSSISRHLTGPIAADDWIDIEPDLYRLRRKKEPDELACLRHAIAATEKMYDRAHEIVRPGINELDVFSELQSVATRALGERMTDTGNDYQSAARGGPPLNKTAEAGTLYILDLGPAYRGYYADNCRTIAVNEPTADQVAACEHLASALEMILQRVRPGVRCRDVFAEVDRHVNSLGIGKFDHHLGHGIGLFPHEGPHLNPDPLWDDVFEVGDVFTAEPGLYDAERLKAGIRLENDYLVTATGVELLSDFPLGLK